MKEAVKSPAHVERSSLLLFLVVSTLSAAPLLPLRKSSEQIKYCPCFISVTPTDNNTLAENKFENRRFVVAHNINHGSSL